LIFIRIKYCQANDSSGPDDDDEYPCPAISADVAVNPAARQTFCFHSGDWIGSGGSETDWDDDYHPCAAWRNGLAARQRHREGK
jgi:hypothetical protein